MELTTGTRCRKAAFALLLPENVSVLQTGAPAPAGGGAGGRGGGGRRRGPANPERSLVEVDWDLQGCIRVVARVAITPPTAQ